jgi:hypothetical protein
MSYQKLIDDYKNKEYALKVNRTTKLAKWAYLNKEGGIFSMSSPSVFIYFVDGDVKITHMNDFVKRLITHYDGDALDSNDEAIFAHSGEINSKEFRKLAKGGMIADAYNIIKIKQVKSDIPVTTKKAISSTSLKRKRLAKASKTLILNSQQYRCAMCKTDISKLPNHFDHRIPLAMGGSDEIENIQALCPNCHATKSQRDSLAISRARNR